MTSLSSHAGRGKEVASASDLPPELLLLVAYHLVPPLTRSEPFRVAHDTTVLLDRQQFGASYDVLLCLSSLNTALRRLLAPLVWQDILIHRPDRLGKLRSLMEYYQRLASSASEIDRLSYPPPLVRRLRVIMPDRYLSLDQEILRHLFRSGMNPANGLHTLEWDAEVLPSPMIWRMLGTDGKAPGLEEILAERKSRTMTRDQIRKMALDADGGTFTISTSTLPRTPRNSTGLDFHQVSELSRSNSRQRGERPDEEEMTAQSSLRQRPRGLESLSLHCRIFYSGSIDMARLRSLRHLRLTSYDSHLLPPHLPSLLLSLHTPLTSISLSTSKTTLLHDLDLIDRGVFDDLEDLDIFAVTPEFPLCVGLRRAGGKLKRLRLILDISSNLDNFDRLFRELAVGGGETGGTLSESHSHDTSNRDTPSVSTMTTTSTTATSSSPFCCAFPELVSLFIEPLPQENTAPSFPRFLDTCPSLQYLNGRRMDGLARTGSGEVFSFDPDHRSGTYFY